VLYVVIATKPVHRLQIQQCTRGHPHHSPKLHPGPCSSVGMRRGTVRHTDTRDQCTSATPHAKCNRTTCVRCIHV